MMDNWHTRLADERDQLSGRIIKLMNFMESNGFDVLMEIEQKRLESQCRAMDEYLYWLNRRYDAAEQSRSES